MNWKEWLAFGVVLLFLGIGCATYSYLSEGRYTMANAAALAMTPVPIPSAPLAVVPPVATSAVVTSVSQPIDLHAFIPNTQEAIKFMPSTKGTRVTFEIPAAEAEKVKQFVKGGQYVLSVREMKP